MVRSSALEAEGGFLTGASNDDVVSNDGAISR